MPSKNQIKDKGFKYWLKYKVGKAPVIYNSRQTERIARSLKTELFNHSYFNAEVKYDIVEKRFKSKRSIELNRGIHTKLEAFNTHSREKVNSILKFGP
jgi:outer membrane protein insertion porin family